jgi:hypothetical protein
MLMLQSVQHAYKAYIYNIFSASHVIPYVHVILVQTIAQLV